jgi:hypothetical protein
MRTNAIVSQLLRGAAALSLVAAPGLAGAQVVATAAVPVDAPSLAERIAFVGNGTVRLSFAARPGVCGNGARASDGTASIVSDGVNRFGMAGARSLISMDAGKGRGAESWCQEGPVNVALTVRDKQVTAVRTYVGGWGRADAKSSADLGTIGSAEAIEYLFALSNQLDRVLAEPVLLAALLADSVDVTSRFLTIARDKTQPQADRERAIWWMTQLPDESVSPALAAIARDDSAEPFLRSAAQRGLTTRASAQRRS